MAKVTARAYLIKPDAAPWATGVVVEPTNVDGVVLAVRAGVQGAPAWAGLVEAVSTSPHDFTTRSGPGAAVFVAGGAAEHGVVFCFGSGRHLLRSGSWVAGFGMRATLNAAARSGDESINSLLSISFATVEESPVAGTLRGTAPRGMTQFSVDSAIDRIRGVRAINLDVGLGVGTALEGATSLAVDVGDVDDFLPLSKTLRELGTADDYTKQWEHLDGFLAVEDAVQLEELNADLQSRLKSRRLEGVSLDPPPEVESFAQVWFGAKAAPEEFTLEAALAGWRSDLAQLLLKKVRFDDGPNAKEFRLRDLLTAQIDTGGDTFVFDQGDWQQVSPERLTAVQRIIDAVDEWPVSLDPWAANVAEGAYLKEYEKTAQFLVLDRKNVSASGATVMEFCDLVEASGAFVHVKRHGTKGLSHLAAQVAGATTRWATEPAFRSAVAAKVASTTANDPTWTSVVSGGARQSDHPVVIAIGSPKSGPLSNILSTLAMLHLHRAIHAVESRGFPVRYRLIPEK